MVNVPNSSVPIASQFAPGVPWFQFFNDLKREVDGKQASGSYQTQDALLTAIAALSMVADRYIYGTGTDTVALGTITSDARSLLADSDVPRLGDNNNWTGDQQIGTYSATGASVGQLMSGFQRRSSATSTAAQGHLIFVNPNGTVGQVFTSGSNTTYATSSDRRLKDIIGDLKTSVALDRILSVRLREYTWRADGAAGYGVIADELARVIPQAVTGETDAIDEEWVVDGKERYLTTTKDIRALDQLADAEDAHKLSEAISPQGVDYSKIVPDLIGAIQAQAAQIAALQKQVAALSTIRI